MSQKPSIPKGTRDFSPSEVSKRNYIISTIKNRFEQFGFAPIETPSMENNETLLGKYGEEGDRLIFKILNSGDFLSQVNRETLGNIWSQEFSGQITEKALRYDLTVPFARYVVMHQNEIDFPFKRYQIQPVWRADRPQKGRYREFFQCDADVVGANATLQEAEFILLYDKVFSDLNLKGCCIKMNNRKILAGIVEIIGAEDYLIDFTVALDKLDKIGKAKVEEEMLSKGISKTAIERAQPLFEISGDVTQKIAILKSFLEKSEIGKVGVAELENIVKAVGWVGLDSSILDVEVTLARGLNYYTGAIFEVAAPAGVQLGSIGGGGRYDDLTSIFGLKDLSGVGISFGLDRIYLVLEQLNLFPKDVSRSLDVLALNFGGDSESAVFKLIALLRNQGLRADLYPTPAKVQKQFKYADKRAIPFVLLIGDEELGQNQFILKNMLSGQQMSFALDNIAGAVDLIQP